MKKALLLAPPILEMSVLVKLTCAALLSIALLNCIEAYVYSRSFSRRAIRTVNSIDPLFCVETSEETEDLSEENLMSGTIVKFKKQIEETLAKTEEIKEEIAEVEKNLENLDAEFGSEIARVKKEFSRIKERSYEEAVVLTNKARAEAVKEILPVTDNFGRAKALLEPLETDDEKAIMEYYEKIVGDIDSLISSFGCVRVESLGQPFDFNFMEAIMTQPSTEYAKDIVCMEYQVGYRLGDKSVRPAMVVVSLGPGPG